MAAKRVVGTEAAKYFDVAKGVPKSEVKAPAGGAGAAARRAAAAGDDRAIPVKKSAKWKQQSEQLRAAMANNRKIVDAQVGGGSGW